jgi:hypothetical protein
LSGVVQRRIVLLVAVAAAVLGGVASAAPAAGRVVPAGAIRPPDAKTDMDTNPANLASAVITHAFGQLPAYIDAASFRLLPFDVFRTAQPERTTVRVHRVTVPHTSLVLDTAMTSGLTEAEARSDAAGVRVAVSLDGAAVPNPARFWVFYRNNGPLICRIYFPGDLSTLNMGVNSLVLRPLAPGRHTLHVVVRRALAGRASATLVTDYALRVLARPPNARERASAPEEDANPASLGNTPLTFRTPNR